jgi:hypothetical protein
MRKKMREITKSIQTLPEEATVGKRTGEIALDILRQSQNPHQQRDRGIAPKD